MVNILSYGTAEFCNQPYSLQMFFIIGCHDEIYLENSFEVLSTMLAMYM